MLGVHNCCALAGCIITIVIDLRRCVAIDFFRQLIRFASTRVGFGKLEKSSFRRLMGSILYRDVCETRSKFSGPQYQGARSLA